MSAFTTALNEQVANEFGASQQYVAIAVWYDRETLPELAARFYAQAVEERNHAMMLVRYLIDAEEAVTIPGVAAPRIDFDDPAEPVALALRQERTVTGQIKRLATLAREEGDLVGEQFLGWFLSEQLEEMSSMAALLKVVERASATSILMAEDYLARTRSTGAGHEAEPGGAPAAAGGAL